MRIVEWDYFEQIIAYDHSIRKNRSRYFEVVNAFLKLGPMRSKNISINYAPEDESLTLNAKRGVALVDTNPSSYLRDKACYLRFLTFKRLNIHVNGAMRLPHLDGLPIEILDVTKSPRASINSRLSLPHLHTIIIKPGQFPEPTLRNMIQSKADFEIIEVTDFN
jgi:hypothetical protein